MSSKSDSFKLAHSRCDAENDPTYTPPTIPPSLCKIIAIALHYLYAVHFLALFVESIHNYTIYTYVHNEKPFLKRWQFSAIMLLAPIVVVAPTAIGESSNLK